MSRDMLSKTNNLKPPDDAALRAAIRDHAGWEAIRAAYNAATGEDRSLQGLKIRAWRLGLKITPAKPGPAPEWDDTLIARILAGGTSYANAVRRYNSATGEQRSESALRARWYLVNKARRECRIPKARGKTLAPPPDGPPIEDPREIQLRIQRIGLYRDCFGIPDRMLTPQEFAEAMDGDPDNWPDEPPRVKPGHLDCSNRDRGIKVCRSGIAKRRTGS
jgi:hypothetical protein